MNKADWHIKDVNVIDVFTLSIKKTDLFINNGRFCAPLPDAEKTIDGDGLYIAPGFIDAHIHIESSKLTPSSFARAVIPHGTTSVVADPHEIANVAGALGIKFMIEDGNSTPLSFFWTLPSCVPATKEMETAGAELDAANIRELLDSGDFVALGEMMNFPGAIASEKEVIEKIEAAVNRGIPVDGHAPMLKGDALQKYVEHFIQTDHESLTIDEALEKISNGMYVQIREGTTSKNFRELKGLFKPELISRIMLVSDDLEAEDLYQKGHMDRLINIALTEGIPLPYVIRAMTLNPSLHYRLGRRGAIAPGYFADCVVFRIEENCIKIERVFKEGIEVFNHKKGLLINFSQIEPYEELRDTVKIRKIEKKDVEIEIRGKNASVIGIIPDQILTEHINISVDQSGPVFIPDLERDILPIVVIERHKGTNRISKGLINGFGLKKGALASSYAHDAHNIICVGTNYTDMVVAINALKEIGGGYAVVLDGKPIATLTLEIGGIMTKRHIEDVLSDLNDIKDAIASTESILEDPFMKLSFMSLSVIPSLKLTDRGLVDVENFSFTDLFK